MKGKTWCVQHSTGWCATKNGKRFKDEDDVVPTLCKFFIMLPIGMAYRKPTCKDCLKK